MKKTLTFFLILCFITSSFAQKSFEGEVLYSVNAISNTPKLSSEQLNALLGNVMHYYMKGADYKSTFNGKMGQCQIYIDKDKKLYAKVLPKDSLFWADVTVNHDTIYKVELKKNDTTILGYNCDKLTFFCNDGVHIYYFNRKFRVDSKLYINHKEGNWYAYLEKSKAIALKEILQRRSMTFIITATSIEQKELDKKIFELPLDIPIAKNPTKF
jgi:hypothetical protein